MTRRLPHYGLALVLLATATVTIAGLVQRSGTVAAQDGQAERVVADMVIWSSPGVEAGHVGVRAGAGHCIELEAGQLSVTVQLVGEPPDRNGAVDFRLIGWRGIDSAASIVTTVTRATATFSTPVEGGLYC